MSTRPLVSRTRTTRVTLGSYRSFALLRPIVDTTAQEAVRERILEAYAEYEEVATATA